MRCGRECHDEIQLLLISLLMRETAVFCFREIAVQRCSEEASLWLAGSPGVVSGRWETLATRLVCVLVVKMSARIGISRWRNRSNEAGEDEFTSCQVYSV